MNRKGLYFLIALALGGASAAHAENGHAPGTPAAESPQGYDSRWYIAPTVGGYYNDSKRHTKHVQVYYGLAVGTFINKHISLEVFADRTSRGEKKSGGHRGYTGDWWSVNVGVRGRYYFGEWTAWRPYVLVGLSASRHHNNNSAKWGPSAEVGVGVSKAITDSTDFRIEAIARGDHDTKSQRGHSNYVDALLGVSLVSRFGAPPAPPVAPAAPAAPDCATLDSDNDGVNDCDDKCPNTPAGTIVGPDGCPQKVVIDLRGVNFKFDRPRRGESNIANALARPTADSLAILDQAVDTLQRYPSVRVTVAGYTDSVGKPGYNQGLSERRAKIVYHYLTSHGISADRLEGPIGHGENDPVDSNKTAQGRARNRRTELQVDQSTTQAPTADQAQPTDQVQPQQ